MPAKIYFPPEQQFNVTKEGAIEVDQQKNAKNKKKIKQKKQGWVTVLEPVFKIIAFLNKHNVIRKHWMYPPKALSFWGHLIGVFLKRVPMLRSGIKQSLLAFYPNLKEEWQESLIHSSAVYFGKLFINLIFRLPLSAFPPYQKMFSYENIELLDEAIEEAQSRGTGVIMLVTHLADILNVIPAFTSHPHDYTIASVANISNSLLYQYIINKPIFDSLYVYPSISFRRIGKYLERHLRKGHLLIIYSDYSHPKQPRMPMWPEEYEYLIHTPQSVQKLQRKTDAIIVPCISTPDDGVMGRTHFKILDNSKLMKVAEQYKDSPKKEFHGRLSMEINRTLFPWIKKYAHAWEEIVNFARVRIADSLKFKQDMNMRYLAIEIHKKIKQIINHSWEPDREDEKILEETEQYMGKIIQSLPDENHENSRILPLKGIKIDLSKITAISEIFILLNFLGEKLEKKGYQKQFSLLKELKGNLKTLED